MGLFDGLFSAFKRKPFGAERLTAEQQGFVRVSQRLADVVNESLKLASESNVIEVKLSRLGVAKDKLEELKRLCGAHQYIKMVTLVDVEASIKRLEIEFESAGYGKITHVSARCESLGAGVGSAQQSFMMDRIVENNKDVVAGYELCVTMKETTPLSYLNRHQEVKAVLSAADKNVDPRYGVWIPKVDSRFSALSEGGTMASDIGPIPLDGGIYLSRLKRMRSIIEQPLKGDDVTEAIRRAVAIDELDGVKRYMDSAGSSSLGEGVLKDLVLHVDDHLLELVLNELSLTPRAGLKIKHVKQLYCQGYTTVQSMKDAPSEVLLALPGVGVKSIAKIRASS